MSKKPQTFSAMFENSQLSKDDYTLPLEAVSNNHSNIGDNKTIFAIKGFDNIETEPVVGWLVVLNGQGKGKSIPIVAGVNSIGRDNSNKIVLNFNDNSVSNYNHCRIIYDPKTHDYFLKHEDGKNLSYLNDKAVLTIEKLTNYARIQLGDTNLLFVALCGKLFKWE